MLRLGLLGFRMFVIVSEFIVPEAYNPEASNFPLCVKILAGAAVQSEARKIVLPKYGIRDSRLKTLSLQRLYK